MLWRCGPPRSVGCVLARTGPSPDASFRRPGACEHAPYVFTHSTALSGSLFDDHGTVHISDP